MTTHIAGAPAVLTSRRDPEVAARRGTVLVYHGFGGDKSKLGDLAGALADAGFLAIRVDIVGHGERRLPDWDEVFSEKRWSEAEEATEAEFLTLLMATAAEVPAIVEELIAVGWGYEGRLGITGRSMGGEISYAAVLNESRIRAAAPMVGSPEWTLPWLDSPHRHAGAVLSGPDSVAQRRIGRVRSGEVHPGLPRPAHAAVRAEPAAPALHRVPRRWSLPDA